MPFRLSRSRIQQSSAGWRYAGAISQHSDEKRNPAGAVCASSGTSDAARFDFETGTIVDSTFIEAPSSTKNEKKERDPEAHSAKKAMYGTLAIKPISE